MDEPEKLTTERLARKIRWEGGLLAALEYGIKAEDIADPEISALWARLAKAYDELAPLVDEAAGRLDVAA
jgi:hypothetical protein